jgi:trigger factor
MQTTVEDTNPTRKKITIEIPVAEYATEYNELIDRLTFQAHIKGVRPGKAPKAVVAKQYNSHIMDHLTRLVLNPAIEKTLDELSVNPVTTPVIMPFEIKDGQPLQFTVSFDYIPKITVPVFDHFELTTFKPKVTDKMIENELLMLAKSVAVIKATEPDHAVVMGDRVVIHSKLFKGQELVSQEDPAEEPASFDLGESNLLPDIETALIGHKTGDLFRLTTILPENYGNPELAGQEITFEITVDSVYCREIPEINDELAKDINVPGVENLGDLKKLIHDNLMASQENYSKEMLRSQVMAKMVEPLDFRMPDSLIDNEIDRVIMDLLDKYQDKNIVQIKEPPETWFKNEDLRSRLKGKAIRNLKSSLLLGKISEVYDIKVKDEEINNVIKLLCAEYPPNDTRIDTFKSKKVFDIYKNSILSDKIYQFVLSKCKIKYVEQTTDLPPLAHDGQDGESVVLGPDGRPYVASLAQERGNEPMVLGPAGQPERAGEAPSAAGPPPDDADAGQTE